jgi:copper chaperone CopZ
MKHKITAIFTITALISLTLFAGETKEVSFNINGMTCQGCVRKVSGVLDKTPGVNNYKVSIEDKNCKISYDAALTNPEAIKTELSKTHFTISDVVVEKQNSSIFSWIKNIFN